MMKRIYVGCDCAAVDLKNAAISLFQQLGIEVVDLGVKSSDDKTAYPIIAHKVCQAMAKDGFNCRGALFCGTGLGMCITANKHKGIYAGVAHDCYSAERLCLSNNANVICMGARVIASQLALKILREWCALEYSDSPSTEKIEIIKQYEKENFN